ncbi:MAG: prepilin-type N-terminal cleavage/methylation domain-containing protein [Gammaproteobacteria bacterium]|nr:prepilin-type N-terminal cleavage/methylation domain-containing protein [Gammaproteobacteria bacterium]
MNSRRRAFTLIELLVVIAIIAILAGILFRSSPRRAKRPSRRTASGNVNQLAKTFIMYASDYDQKLPRLYADVNGDAAYAENASGTPNGADYAWAWSLHQLHEELPGLHLQSVPR